MDKEKFIGTLINVGIVSLFMALVAIAATV